MNKIKNSIIALAALLSFTACDTDDTDALIDGQPVRLGTVTASIGAAIETKATDPETGYDGVVKKEFVADDIFKLTYYQGTKKDEAYFILGADGTWTAHTMQLAPTVVYLNTVGDKTGVTAYSGIEEDEDQETGITTYGDDLTATGTTDADGNVALTFTHVNALLTVTANYANGTTATLTDVIITLNDDEDDVKIAPAASDSVIAPAGFTIMSVSYELDGKENTVAAPTVTVEAGKKYDITLDLGVQTATMTISSNIPNWTLEEGRLTPPEGWMYIYDADDLAAFRTAVNGDPDNDIAAKPGLNAMQMANITMPEDDWEPIGDRTNFYAGRYNGNGYTISGLTIDASLMDAGLFGAINTNGELVNIHLTDVDINNNNDGNAGALCGWSKGGVIALCSSTGEVSGGEFVGGLIGSNTHGGTITRSRSTASVTSTYNGAQNMAGGLTAYNGGGADCGTIVACMAGGSVTATNTNVSGEAYTGGLVGGDLGGTIAYCYATGTVTPGTDNVRTSGFVAFTGGSTISYCYTTNDTFAIIATTNCWKFGDAGKPSDIVNDGTTDEITATADGVKTWRNGGMDIVTFDGTKVWKDAATKDFPTIDYTYAGEVTP